MRKYTNYFSEIGNFFKGNDVTSALNAVNDVISSLKMTENDSSKRRASATASLPNCRFYSITDGVTQMLLDFCLVGEKGKNGTYNLKQKQLER